MNELLDRIALSLAPGLGPRSWNKLLDVFGDAGTVLAADHELIRRKVPGVGAKVIAAIDRVRLRAEAESELERASRAGIRIIASCDDDYPELLSNISDPPVLLYVKGDAALLRSPCLGIVGARASTVYGQRIAADLAGRLCRRGLTVVSGLALGIDAAAHSGALRANGATIAVLGCGLDVVYPRQNENLHAEIGERGALVSEYRLGTLPEPFRFPARNRIISGLSLGVVVVEAAKKSGSLITARMALEQGREVFAIPGRIDSSKSEGAHRLLQEGAKLVHSVDDILEEIAHGVSDLCPPQKKSAARIALSTEEAILFALLDVYPRNIDELIQQSGMTAQKVNEVLLLLELKGAIEVLPGGQYQKKGEGMG
ncbi:MAG: DNA protecting protein DprA [Desulfobulbaceae bacterium DB1]|nr:MAG: DNA protecting protein DprA [Desulfobulbaceae bacterium DB1]